MTVLPQLDTELVVQKRVESGVLQAKVELKIDRRAFPLAAHHLGFWIEGEDHRLALS